MLFVAKCYLLQSTICCIVLSIAECYLLQSTVYPRILSVLECCLTAALQQIVLSNKQRSLIDSAPIDKARVWITNTKGNVYLELLTLTSKIYNPINYNFQTSKLQFPTRKLGFPNKQVVIPNQESRFWPKLNHSLQLEITNREAGNPSWIECKNQTS